MEIGKAQIGALLKDRVLGNKVTTIIGCILAALGAAGLKLSSDHNFENIGNLMVQISAFAGHIVLLVAKDKDKGSA